MRNVVAIQLFVKDIQEDRGVDDIIEVDVDVKVVIVIKDV